MAEFVEVMWQWGRLCKQNYMLKLGCDGCLLCGTRANLCGEYAKDTAKSAAEIERLVMEWAAENPGPVYPTWVEWFNSIGGVDCGEPIPAEIAEKLGIEPKEG